MGTDELKALRAKATQGKWQVTNGGLGIEGQPSASTDYDPLVIGGCKGGKGMIDFPSYGMSSIPGRKEGEANAALIVAAVNALPALLSRIETLEGLLERAAQVAEEFPKKHRATPQPGEKSRFDIYDIERWVKTACALVAEDIRALSPPAAGGK